MANPVVEFLKRPGFTGYVNGIVMSVVQYEPTERDKQGAKDKGWRIPETEYSLLVNANDLGEIKVKFDRKQFPSMAEMEALKDCCVRMGVEYRTGKGATGKEWKSFTLVQIPTVVIDADGKPAGK